MREEGKRKIEENLYKYHELSGEICQGLIFYSRKLKTSIEEINVWWGDSVVRVIIINKYLTPHFKADIRFKWNLFSDANKKQQHNI